jgi:hypothetical protein
MRGSRAAPKKTSALTRKLDDESTNAAARSMGMYAGPINDVERLEGVE